MKKPVYVCCVFNVYIDFPDEEFPDETPDQRRMRKEWRGHVLGLSPDEAQATTYALYDKRCDVHWYTAANVAAFETSRGPDGREFLNEAVRCPRCGQEF